MFKNITLLVLISIFMGCEDTSPPPIIGNDPAVSDPEYNFYRFTVRDTTGTSGQIIFELKGDSIDGKWDFDNNFVWLSTDENRVEGPYCTLTVFFSGASNNAGLLISSAVLSITDVLVGTAAELNARTYSASLNEGYLSPKKVNEDLIWGILNIDMVRTAPNNSSEPESINLTGFFAAKKK